MSLDKKQLGEIAYLARLKIDDKQIDDNIKDLNNILDLAEQLKQIDTTKIQPMSHPLHQTQPLRADEVTEFDQSDSFQKIAPKVMNKHYLVPKVIE